MDVENRINKTRVAANECLNIVNKKEMKLNRITMGLKLFATCVVPVMLFGAEAWKPLKQKEKNEISNIQTQFLTKLLRLPRTTPKCALFLETKTVKLEHLINQRKIEYYININNREEEALEYKIRKYGEKMRESMRKKYKA